MQQLHRVYKLSIGSDSQSVAIENLRISFEIIKTIEADPNQGTFAICNLSPSNRALITEKKYDRIKFEAGYRDGGLKTLFLGFIDTVENFIEGTDTITNIVAADGAKDYREAVTSKTIAKGSTKKEIVTQILEDMPETDQGAIDIDNEEKSIRAKALFGSCRDVLGKLSTGLDSKWSIQDNELMVLKNDSALANDEGFLLSRETGMIGSPAKNSDGLEVKCYLNNIMKIGQLCAIESQLSEYSGSYKINKITMMGDTHSSEWYSVLIVENGQFKKVDGAKA